MRHLVLLLALGCGGTSYGPPTDATHILIDETFPGSPLHTRLQLLGLSATFTHAETTFDEKSALMTLTNDQVQGAIDALADVDFLSLDQPEPACPGAGTDPGQDVVTVDLTEGSNMLTVRLDCTGGIQKSLADTDQRILRATGFADWVAANFP